MPQTLSHMLSKAGERAAARRSRRCTTDRPLHRGDNGLDTPPASLCLAGTAERRWATVPLTTCMCSMPRWMGAWHAVTDVKGPAPAMYVCAASTPRPPCMRCFHTSATAHKNVYVFGRCGAGGMGIMSIFLTGLSLPAHPGTADALCAECVWSCGPTGQWAHILAWRGGGSQDREGGRLLCRPDMPGRPVRLGRGGRRRKKRRQGIQQIQGWPLSCL